MALRHVRLTIAAVEKQYELHILGVVCSLSYPACNAHAQCSIAICGLSGCTIFSTVSDKPHDILANVIEHQMIGLILSETFLFLRRTE